MERAPAAALSRLAGRLDAVRRADRQRIDQLFRTLGPRLAGARRVERALDRVLANRFNPLDYLRTDELGLSRILADLLDPGAAHGQGTAFLGRFLDRVGNALPDEPVPSVLTAKVNTRRERSIDGGGRLDISVEIGVGNPEPWCIAIENKPYAADGEGQVDAYLRYLRRRYPGRFLLIYLSPHGGLPSADSLPPDAATDGLATLSYCPQSGLGLEGDTTRRLPFALTDWLRECGLSCAVDRLRWFLRDAENFCHKTFGGVMTTAGEHREVRDFMLESEDNLLAALAVLDAYPETRNEVIAGFLKGLHAQIARKLQRHGLETDHYFGDRPDQDGVWAYRDSWEGDSATPYVWLGHDGRNASAWWLGVGFDPKGSGDSRIDQLREPLAAVLGPTHARSANFPWYRFLDPYRDWAPLLVRMHQERSEPGALIDHFTTEFVAVAREAVKIIDRELAGA